MYVPVLPTPALKMKIIWKKKIFISMTFNFWKYTRLKSILNASVSLIFLFGNNCVLVIALLLVFIYVCLYFLNKLIESAQESISVSNWIFSVQFNFETWPHLTLLCILLLFLSFNVLYSVRSANHIIVEASTHFY